MQELSEGIQKQVESPTLEGFLGVLFVVALIAIIYHKYREHRRIVARVPVNVLAEAETEAPVTMEEHGSDYALAEAE